MMDSELKKTSMRANALEKKRFDMMMASFDIAKRNVAVDMKKSQLDFKRRLKRYKDRQREIIVTRSGPSSCTMEEFMIKQLRRRNQMNHAIQQSRPPTTSAFSPHRGVQPSPRPPTTTPRPPATTPRLQGGNSASDPINPAINVASGSDKSQTGTSSSCSGAALTASPGESTDHEDEEADFVKLSHCRRSKIDLRPCTAWTTYNISKPLPGTGNVTRSTPGSVRLLHARNGSLGTPASQVRYLNDEEIEERSMFYRFLVDGFLHIEHERLETLNNRVERFCGKPNPGGGNNRKLSSCPPLVKVGVTSLPPGVPPIIHQAMRVRMPAVTTSAGHLKRGKTL